MNPSIPELSVDRAALVRVLEAVQPGEVVEYAVLSLTIRRNVQKEARHILDKARHHVLKESKVVFEAVMNVGLKRLDDSGCVAVGSFTLGVIRRAANRGTTKVNCANYGELSRDDQIKHNTHLANLGAIALMTKASSVKRLTEAVTLANHTLPSAEVLQLFTK